MKLTAVELFAGVGGFRVGLNHVKEFDKKTGLAIEQGDWEFVWANQWEPATKMQPAFDCYQTRFGENVKAHSNLDINEVDKSTIPNHSLLVGGFPCQDYSVARTISNELGIQGKKGVLWWDIVDTIFSKRPPFVLLENVDRLLKSPASERGRDFAVMLKTLDEFGYIVHWRMINAGDYSMPQRRRRVFIFAVAKDTKHGRWISAHEDKEKYLIEDGFFNDLFPIKKPAKVEYKDLACYKDAVEISEKFDQGKFLTSGVFMDNKVINFDIVPVEEELYTLGKIINQANKFQGLNLEKYIIDEDKLEKWEYLKGGKKIPRKRPDGTDYFYAEGNMSCPDVLELPARTMLTSESTANRSSHIVKDTKTGKLRTITAVEAEAIQMFPHDWTNTGMSERQRYFMMGNALVTGVISRLEPKLKRIIEEE
ncbi:MAG TPA: DNA (cytosine-5-)-methyltransferase [Epulopiscium sp.]|nr:DNA (cytosine-5-)-methyltransferase [Candidatus Epulonipiscium sp.]